MNDLEFIIIGLLLQSKLRDFAEKPQSPEVDQGWIASCVLNTSHAWRMAKAKRYQAGWTVMENGFCRNRETDTWEFKENARS
jgi:hypothetical protein